MRALWLLGALALAGCSVNLGSVFCDEDADCPSGYACVTEDNACVAGPVPPPACSEDVAAGQDHTCSLRTGGTVWCWGRNSHGQLGNGGREDALEPVQVVGISNATAVVAGESHSCALLDGGAVACWGRNNGGQLGDNNTNDSNEPVTVLTETALQALAAGAEHTCALDPAGAVVCWGANHSGQLGNNTTTSSSTPIRVGITAARIAAGGGATCAIGAAGELHCWGSNDEGQLGLGDFLERREPTPVPGVGGVTMIDMAEDHTCVVIAGEVRCAGYNDDGELGSGTRETSTVFQSVRISSPIVELALGRTHSCARDDQGRVWCWGANGFGQLADGTTQWRFSPVLSSVARADQLTVGEAHTCVRDAGAIWCIGHNGFGQLANGERTTQGAPQAVPGVRGIEKVAAGAHFTCAVGMDKTAQCWGENDHGELGDGTFVGRATPEPLGLTDVQQLVAGGHHACAIAGGKLWCWGWNDDGQLGDGTQNTRGVPGIVPAIANPVAVAVGDFHTCAIDRDATGVNVVKCWSATLGSETPVIVGGLTQPIGIAAGTRHTCALLANKTVMCWGDNDKGQLGTGDLTNSDTPRAVVDIANAVEVRARDRTTEVRLESGAVKTWGYGCNGRLGNPDTDCSTYSRPQNAVIQDVTALSLGYEPSCAIKRDSTVSCWGPNWFGQVGDGTYVEKFIPTQVHGLAGVIDVAAGGEHACAVKQDGTVACWGHDLSGQLGDGIGRRVAPTPARLVCE